MSTAAAIVSARVAQPGSSRAGTRASATPNAFAVLISLVFNAIARGRNLAVAFRGHAVCRMAATLCGTGAGAVRRLGMSMRCGAVRSLALSARLWHWAICARRRQRPALRSGGISPRQCGTAAQARAAAKDEAFAGPVRPEWPQACDPSCLPMAAAAAARGHAAGAVLADICSCFGRTLENAAAARDAWRVPANRLGRYPLHVIAEVDRCKAPASRVGTPRFDARPEHHRPDSLSAEEQSCDVAPPQTAPAGCSSPQAEPCAASGETCVRTETAPVLYWPVSSRPAREVAATA